PRTGRLAARFEQEDGMAPVRRKSICQYAAGGTPSDDDEFEVAIRPGNRQSAPSGFLHGQSRPSNRLIKVSTGSIGLTFSQRELALQPGPREGRIHRMAEIRDGRPTKVSTYLLQMRPSRA